MNLVYDIGLHLGEDAEFYLKKGFRVVGIEAHPRLCKEAENRLAPYVKTGQLTIINGAIAEEDGTVPFYDNLQKTVWGTTSRVWMERNRRLNAPSREINVPSIALEKILQTYETPYYVKIDIEGADRICLESLLKLPRSARPRYVSLESEKVLWGALLQEFELLQACGYGRFKIIDQAAVPRQRCPVPPREGVFVNHVFEPGSSGMFGEEAPGPWMTAAAAIQVYRQIFFRYWIYGDDGLLTRSKLGRKIIRRANLKMPWYDTHATF